MPTLFISDLQLDDQRPQATLWLLDFLEREARHADALYILGDLFEYWLGDDAPTRTGRQVADALQRLHVTGVPAFFMHGNRDFLLGSDYARSASMQILPEEVVVDLYGVPTLLMHGDSLCTDDLAYQKFRAMVRDPAWQRAFLAKSPEERMAFAGQARAESDEHKQGVSMDIMDVNPTSVTRAFKRAGVEHMIHGHTHRPAIHEHPLGASTGQRVVLGDWYEQGSVLRVSADGFDLQTL